MQRKPWVVWGKCAKLNWTQSNSLNSMSIFCCCCYYNLKQQSLGWTSITKAGFLQSSVLPHCSLMFKFLYHEPANKTPILQEIMTFSLCSLALPELNDFWWFFYPQFKLCLQCSKKPCIHALQVSHWVHLQNWKGLWLIVESLWFSWRWVTQLAEFKCHWHTH